MHFFNLLVAWALSTSLAVWQVDAQSSACIYMTTDVNWLGDTQRPCAPSGQCGQIPNGFANNILSAGPKEEAMTCFLYDRGNCTGNRSAPIVSPGYADLSDPAIDFANRAQSWMCWQYCSFANASSSISATRNPTATPILSKPSNFSTITSAISTTLMTVTYDNRGTSTTSTLTISM